MRDILAYSPGDTAIHRLNPITKICLAFCICVAAFAADSLPFLLALLALNLAVGAAGKVFEKAVGLLIGLAKVSSFLFVLQILFVREGNTLFLFVTEGGLISALKLVLRFMTACVPLALMLAVTRTNDLANALVKVTRLPYQYAFTLSTAIRFIPLFMSEMAGILEAQTARGVEFDQGGFLKKIRLILPLCVPLLIISVRKIDGAAVSAEVRGFYLRTRECGYKTYPMRAADFGVFLLCAALVGAGIYL